MTARTTIPEVPTTSIPSQSQLDSLSEPQKNSLSNLFEEAIGWWKNVSHTVLHPNELIVRELRDNSGHTLWYIYDPLTGKTKWAENEAEAVQWIEDNY